MKLMSIEEIKDSLEKCMATAMLLKDDLVSLEARLHENGKDDVLDDAYDAIRETIKAIHDAKESL